MKRRLFPLHAACCLIASLFPAVLLGACGSHSIGARASGADKDPSLRSTEIGHEPCDIDSKTAARTDVNGDGKPDIIEVMSNGHEVCRAVDLNFDGRFDTFVYFDGNGKERRRESDFDRDGAIDEIETLRDGVTVTKERETNLDGKLDTWDTYAAGKLAKRERDTSGDGRVDQWWEFPNPNRLDCPVIAIDQDADGRPDVRQDICKENDAEKAVDAPPAAAPPASSASTTPPVPPVSASPASSAAPSGKGGTP